jgi:spore coat protein CotH
MIAWDYNLAFGAMNRGSNSNSAATMVNYPIDTPTSGVTMDKRPMLGELLGNAGYLQQYHELFHQFMTDYFDSGKFAAMYDNALNLISPYVQNDPTAFCDYEDFKTASAMLKKFCLLRAQSVEAQLSGAIESTDYGQADSNDAGFVDATGIDISAMGRFNLF